VLWFVPSDRFVLFCSNLLLKSTVTLYSLTQLNVHKFFCTMNDIEERLQARMNAVVELDAFFQNPSQRLRTVLNENPSLHYTFRKDALEFLLHSDAIASYGELEPSGMDKDVRFRVEVKCDAFKNLKTRVDERYARLREQETVLEASGDDERSNRSIVCAENDTVMEQKTSTIPIAIPGFVSIFKKDGDGWHISFEGNTFHLTHSIGLAYIHALLKNPEKELKALDLSLKVRSNTANSDGSMFLRKKEVVGDVDQSFPDDDTATDVMDEHMRQDLVREIARLDKEIDKLDKIADIEIIRNLKEEREKIQSYLKKNTGLRGKIRKEPSASEKARSATTLAIGRALNKIKEHNMQLYEYLKSTIRTGYISTYTPPSKNSPLWNL